MGGIGGNGMTRAALKTRTTEIIEDLRSALEELQVISEDLAQTPGVRRN
jgi:hypothetical protein